jgi:hypothetical protein
MKDGRRFSRRPNPYTPPTTPAGRVNLTDPDSRVVKGLRGFIQGYNAQAITNEAAGCDRGRGDDRGARLWASGADARRRRGELQAAGVEQTPGVLLADAGYWHQQQMERIVDRGVTVLIPPDASKRKGARPRRRNRPSTKPALRRQARRTYATPSRRVRKQFGSSFVSW